MSLFTKWLMTFMLVGCFTSNAQDIMGKWKTIDDKSGEPRSIIEITKEGDEYFGRVLNIYSKPDEDPDPICDLCEDDRKNQKVIGMQVIREMKFNPKSKEYGEGTIIDPEDGNIYDCKLWVAEDGALKVRGYLYFFFRTQTWLPFDE
ncbi:MAG: hypothetical protein ACJA08_000188 [Cyclobacteriaceae bacterium]|jgi:uncharacterized protein (DUF2147 family)